MDIVAIDVRMINSSGIGVCIRNIIPYLTDNLKLVLLGKEKEIERFINPDKNAEIIETNSKIYSITEQIELFRKIPRCDIFWSPHYNVPIFLVKAKKRLVTIHDVFHLAYSDTLNVKQKIYARVMINSAVKLSDKILTNSEFSKSEIIKYTGTGEEKIKVIYNGVDLSRFKKRNDENVLKTIKDRYNLPDKFLLYVGNVKPHKNLSNLLKAFEKLNQKGLYLVIVGKKEGFITGDNRLFDTLKNNQGLSKQVLFTGYVKNEDLSAIYNLASCFIFPSTYEGFGLPPLEAMACGCPVVVSNAASLPEVCGNAAYYVDPYNVESIAEGIYKVLTDETLRQSLIQKGIERAKLFSWERSAKEHLKVFEKVLNS